MQYNWTYMNQVAGCQNRHTPNKLATLWKKEKKKKTHTHTHYTKSKNTENPSYELRGNNKRIYKARSRGETRRNFYSGGLLEQPTTGHHRCWLSTVSNQDLTSSGRKQQIWDNKPTLLSHQLHQVQVQVQNAQLVFHIHFRLLQSKNY